MMKRVPLMLLAVCLLFGLALYNLSLVNGLNGRMNADRMEGRIIDLPEDGDLWHTSLFVRGDYRRIDPDRRLMAAFESQPQLVSLRAQTQFHDYPAEGADYRDRFAKHVPPEQLPAVLLQKSDGTVVFKASGAHVADDPNRLARHIRQAIQEDCRNGRCRPRPVVPVQPAPFQPQPLPYPVSPIPDLGPADNTVSPDVVIIGGFVLAIVVGGVVGLAKFKRDVSGGGV